MHLQLCKCGYVRTIGEPCPTCAAEESRPHVLMDTPANRAALEPVAVLLYNALGELARASPGLLSPTRLHAALVEAERVLATARVRAEARSTTNALALAAACAPEPLARALRRIGPQTPIIRRPYEALEAKPKKG